jgi:hypothetical protein
MALVLNRANYMLGYQAQVELVKQDIDVNNLNSSTMMDIDIHMFINKSVKNSREIMDKIDIAFSEL